MVDIDKVYVAVGSVAMLGGLAVWRTSVARKTRRVMVDEPVQELRRLETIIDGITSVGTLERVYQNGSGYLDQQKQKILLSSVGSNVLKIDPVESLRTKSYLNDKLETIDEIGKDCNAQYFSLTEPSYVNRFALYGISFHRRLGGE